MAHHTYTHRVQTILDTVRALCPGFESCSAGPLARGDNLVEYLPRGCTSLLDYGVGLGISKLALARRGITRFDGYTFDAVAIESDHATEFAIRAAWQSLVQGGTLLLKIDTQKLTYGTDLSAWFRQHDFHIAHTKRLAAGSTLIIARKRTRRLRDIAREVCNTLNVPGVTSDSVSALLDPDW